MTPTLTITLLPSVAGERMTVTVNGPLRNKILCMKMLAQAIILVEEYQEPTIQLTQQMPRNVG